MYSAETTIVDVKQTGESEYTLSMTAKDLYVAAQSGDVLRRHDVSVSDKAPEKKYVALSGVKFAEATGKYTFTFASGDVFESTSDTAYPTASSISDSTDELPSITDADDGKVLTVEVTKEKGAVIVPQQSVNVTFGPPIQLSNTVGDLFVEGAKVIMTVDGVENTATVEDVGGNTVRAVYGNGPAVFSKYGDQPVAISGLNGTHTVSMNIEDSSVEWEAQTPGGGVLVVTDTAGTLDKTWQEIHDAPFAVRVIESDEYSKQCASLSDVYRDGRDEPYSYIVTFGDDATYSASSASGYPTLAE